MQIGAAPRVRRRSARVAEVEAERVRSGSRRERERVPEREPEREPERDRVPDRGRAPERAEEQAQERRLVPERADGAGAGTGTEPDGAAAGADDGASGADGGVPTVSLAGAPVESGRTGSAPGLTSARDESTGGAPDAVAGCFGVNRGVGSAARSRAVSTAPPLGSPVHPAVRTARPTLDPASATSAPRRPSFEESTPDAESSRCAKSGTCGVVVIDCRGPTGGGGNACLSGGGHGHRTVLEVDSTPSES